MQSTLILQYPEFIFAGLLGLIVFLSDSFQQRSFSLPAWICRPAIAVLLALPERYLAFLQKMLVQANWRNNASFGTCAASKVYLPILTSASILLLPPYAVCLIALISFFIPDLFLIVKVRLRQQAIRYGLPQALDLMVLCVDAGLGLDAVLQRIALDQSGLVQALNEELNILGRDIFLGMDRDIAYQELYNRTGVDELKTLGSALNQASKLGLSVARILRTQSDFIRLKQSQKAEEKAMKMPIYMAFPLWFFIMPTLLLLVLGPSLIKFYHALHGSMP